MTQLQTMVKGSLAERAASAGTSIAEAFTNADVIILVDTSGSMDQRDAPGGRTRFDAAVAELAQLQATLSGRIAVVAFSSEAAFCPSGVPTNFGLGTDVAEALRFVHIADGLIDHFILLSDGAPDSETEALAEARKFTTPIKTVHIGSETDVRGRDFLRRLAAATGGQAVTADRVKELAASVQQLLLTAA